MTLKQKYETEIKKTLVTDLGLKNSLEAPKLVKVVLNVGIGDHMADNKAIEAVKESLGKISGQAPALRLAKKAIAGFKLREGQPVGLMVTLRGERMYSFLQKLVSVVFPRVRDFRGLSLANFDKNGNYSLGFPEQVVFPEVDMGNTTKIHGLEVTIVSTSRNAEEGMKLLTALGFKFKEGKGN